MNMTSRVGKSSRTVDRPRFRDPRPFTVTGGHGWQGTHLAQQSRQHLTLFQDDPFVLEPRHRRRTSLQKQYPSTVGRYSPEEEKVSLRGEEDEANKDMQKKPYEVLKDVAEWLRNREIHEVRASLDVANRAGPGGLMDLYKTIQQQNRATTVKPPTNPLYDATVCRICLEEKIRHVPSCGHTYCGQCLQKCRESLQWSCGFCRKPGRLLNTIPLYI